MLLRILFILFLFLQSATAQTNISGTVLDSSNVPVEMATVVLKKGAIIIGNTLTNENGKYSLTISEKEILTLSVYYVGIESQETVLNFTKDTTVNIVVSNSKLKLDEITVTAKNLVIERKIDRLVFNVENSIAATGGDAFDVLKITPGIIVKNEIASMIGKSSLRVMLNEKMVQLTGDELTNFLKSISAANISKIEVISNPSSKYDAEGNSGLINIKLKSTITDSWSSSANVAYIKNTYSTGRGGANFSYQKKKTTFFSNINLTSGSREITDQSKIHYADQLWTNKSPRKVTSNSLTGGLGIDYAVLDNWIIGCQYLGSSSDYSIKNFSSTKLFNNQNQIDSVINTNSDNKEIFSDHSANLSSTFNFDTLGKKMIVNLDYFQYQLNNNGTFQNNNFFSNETKTPGSYYSAHNTNNQQIQNYSTKIDFEHPIKWVNLSYGAKFASTTTNNNIKFYNTTTGESIIDLNKTNTFKYIENTEALYLSGSKKISAKWELQLGLRGEATQTTGNSKTLNQLNTYSYLKIFPTAYISYAMNESSTIALNYGRRINRPNYEQLNPFRLYSNPYLYVEGNPFLKPSFSDNLELNHTIKNFNTKVYYSSLTNGFQQIPVLDTATGTQQILVQNFYSTNTIGLSESFTFNKFQWWESNNSIDIYYSKSQSSSNITQRNVESFNAFLSTSNDFVLNKKRTLFFNITYWYNFPGNADLMRSTASSQLDASIKGFLLKKKITLSLSAQDIFSQNRPIYSMYSNGVLVEYKNYYDNRCVRISLSYQFGNNKINVSEKDPGNAEEKNRVGN